MRKSITTTLTMFAVVCALAVTVMAQGNGNNGNGNNGNTGNGQNNNTFVDESLQEKEDGGNNGFSDRQDISIAPIVQEKIVAGTEVYAVFTITNISGRAIPDITFRDVMLKNDDNEYPKSYKGEILGHDSYGKPFYSISLSDGESFDFSVLLDTDLDVGYYTLGELLTLNFDIWTRYGNKNWQDILWGTSGNCDDYLIEIIKLDPTWPPEVQPGTDGYTLDIFSDGFPVNDNDGEATVQFSEDGENWTSLVWASTGQIPGTTFNTGRCVLSLHSGMKEGYYKIDAWAKYQNKNYPGGEAHFEFYLFVVDGKPFAIACPVCGAIYDGSWDCDCE